ncbi:Major facilitator superfamily domain-containing protein 1 [Vanrija pseudolonga]|uniref:Lysosomal dipeptide transporter MFSD1 n=1 Tax=Vanrija pseudolonga TaxID=143232 RepID=A0AAF0Y6K3_9TREE|nr:Major facilitator superfamily domain-containing protein 1 [Vanrija pseudolonga]
MTTPATEALSDYPHEKSPDDEGGVDGASTAPPPEIPTRVRVTAVCLIILFFTGVQFAESVILPLKTLLKKELKINNAQYGVVSSASSVVNTVLPIIGGGLMDRWGGKRVALVSSFIVTLGSVLAAISSVHNNYSLLVGGEILLGFGSTVSEVCQYKLYPHYVSGRHMALVFGLTLAWNRLISVIAKVAAVPMTQLDHHWGWALWISAILCAFSFGSVVAYALYERSLPKEYRPPSSRNKKQNLVQLTGIPLVLQLPKFYWIMNATQMLQHGVWAVYNANVADMQVKTRGTTQEAAGYNSSLQSVIPVVLTPVAGFFFDRVGHRMTFVSLTAALYIVVFVLIGLTKVNALAPIILSSFAYVTNLLPYFAALPILIDGTELLGTAFGVFQAFANSGSLIMNVAVGAIQDNTPHQKYDRVIYLLIALKVVDVVLGPVYIYLDRRWLRGSLQLPERTRVAILDEVHAEGDTLEGLKTSKLTTAVCGGILIAMTITGITIYVIYSLGASDS